MVINIQLPPKHNIPVHNPYKIKNKPHSSKHKVPYTRDNTTLTRPQSTGNYRYTTTHRPARTTAYRMHPIIPEQFISTITIPSLDHRTCRTNTTLLNTMASSSITHVSNSQSETTLAEYRKRSRDDFEDTASSKPEMRVTRRSLKNSAVKNELEFWATAANDCDVLRDYLLKNLYFNPKYPSLHKFPTFGFYPPYFDPDSTASVFEWVAYRNYGSYTEKSSIVPLFDAMKQPYLYTWHLHKDLTFDNQTHRYDYDLQVHEDVHVVNYRPYRHAVAWAGNEKGWTLYHFTEYEDATYEACEAGPAEHWVAHNVTIY